MTSLLDSSSTDKLGFLSLTVFFLTLYVLGAIIVETIWELSSETSRLLQHIDFAICCFFVFEFLYRFKNSEHKLEFMKWGWIDLLSSIPMVDFLRFGRILRLLRLIRIIRAFKSTQQLLHHLFLDRGRGTLTSVSVMAVLLIIFSSIAILQVESESGTIQTAEDAIWWTTTTLIGQAEAFPNTTEGKVIAIVLMTYGVGIFGTFTAYIASLLVSDKAE